MSQSHIPFSENKKERREVASNSCIVHYTFNAFNVIYASIKTNIVNSLNFSTCICINLKRMKVIVNQIEPLTEQQIVGICGLQQSTQEAEEALSQGLEALNQSLSDSIVSDSLSPASAPLPPHLSNFMSHMSLALNKLSALEGFVLQVPSNSSFYI